MIWLFIPLKKRQNQAYQLLLWGCIQRGCLKDEAIYAKTRLL